MPGEFDFIDWIRTQVGKSDRVIVPPGDDLAVLKWKAGDLLLVGVDQVLDGVHFDSAVHSPHDIGRKVMNRNLSDCAAMAALPAAAVATVALPRARDIEYGKQLFLGMKSAADAYGFPVVGGDTASWDGKLVMTVSILGRSDRIRPITRGGAKAGDAIFVTGPLGGSLLGRHLTFRPRVHTARMIAEQYEVHSMIDLSDGLSRDLRHICGESALGAVIDAAAVPIHDDAIEMRRRDGRSLLEHALHDGEDHELLFTMPAAWAGRSLLVSTSDSAGCAITCIGRMTPEREIWLEQDGQREPLEPKGWEHRL